MCLFFFLRDWIILSRNRRLPSEFLVTTLFQDHVHFFGYRSLKLTFHAVGWWYDCVKIDASIILDAKYDQRLMKYVCCELLGIQLRSLTFTQGIAQNEWTSLITHNRRSGKFECTSALNNLQIREEWAIFGPPALIKLLVATSLAPKSQKHGRNIKNELFIYGLSTKYINFTY